MKFNDPSEVEQLLVKNRIWGKRYRSKPGYKEYNRQRMAEWREKNPERHRELSRESYHRNSDKAKVAQGIWWRRNKAKKYAIILKRNAIKKMVTVDSCGISEWMSKVLSESNYTCSYCGGEFPTTWIHFDHIVPLSRGGSHSLKNLCASCPECNLSKQNKLVSEWRGRN